MSEMSGYVLAVYSLLEQIERGLREIRASTICDDTV